MTKLPWVLFVWDYFCFFVENFFLTLITTKNSFKLITKLSPKWRIYGIVVKNVSLFTFLQDHNRQCSAWISECDGRICAQSLEIQSKRIRRAGDSHPEKFSVFRKSLCHWVPIVKSKALIVQIQIGTHHRFFRFSMIK